MKTIIFVSCGAKKKKTSVRAKDMYISNLFRKALGYAERLSLKTNAEVYILSAKYGLLEPTHIIEPYNCTLNDFTKEERKLWAQKVIKQIENKGYSTKEDRFVFLAGRKYYSGLIEEGGIINYECPYQDNNLKGIGYILQFLTN